VRRVMRLTRHAVSLKSIAITHSDAASIRRKLEADLVIAVPVAFDIEESGQIRSGVVSVTVRPGGRPLNEYPPPSLLQFSTCPTSAPDGS
jgi:hypothetical protein